MTTTVTIEPRHWDIEVETWDKMYDAPNGTKSWVVTTEILAADSGPRVLYVTDTRCLVVKEVPRS